VLTAATRQSEEDGVLARTEGLWVALADLAVQSGRTDLVSGYLAKVTLVAARTGTETAEIAVLTLRALVGGDEACADAAVRLVRRRDQPLEQVFVLPRLVQYGVGDPALLAPVYALLGDMKALLGRARLRTMMRAYGVGVPGRQEAVAENERLLAVLVAEGLSNRQIATVLDCGERSVEGRLSRLFARSGHRSRVALATAMLTGRFR
jgi:DNA-binding CsgD family transcriptional regulator